MLNALIPGLTTLIITVRRNLFAAVMTTLMILSIIIVWSARGNISTWLESNPTAAQQTERNIRSVTSDRKINDIMESDLVKLNADRVFIRQFNDQYDQSTKTVIPSVTVTYHAVAPGVSFSADHVTMPRAYVSDVINAVWRDPAKPQCAKFSLNDIKDEVYHGYLIKGGVVLFYTCPIMDIGGSPIGMVNASYLTLTKSRPTDQEIFSRLNDTGIRIAGYLDEVTAPEKEVWYRKLLSN